MTDDGLREVHVRIERREGRRAERIAWLGLALIVVLTVKPWGQPAPPERPGRPAVQAQATQPPSFAEADKPCLGSWWSVEVDEHAIGRVVRAWVLTEAVEAAGPLDARIPFVTVAAQQVIGLGVCPPFHDAQPGSSATFFRLDPTPTEIDTRAVRMPRVAEVRANTLYRPTPDRGPGASASETPWPAGRYVIRIDAEDGYERWLGVVVRLVSFPGARQATGVPPT